MQTFTLTITLGNDAMQGREDVPGALGVVAFQVGQTDEESGAIRDENGNTCGRWEFTTEVAR